MRPTKRNPGVGDARVSEIVLHGQAADRPRIITPPLWLQREAQALHVRGPRPLGEIFFELIETFGPELRDFLRVRLAAYNRISPEIYVALGADRFARPFAVIGGGRS